MNYSLLKKARVFISLTFFLSLSVLFLDLTFSLPEKFSDYPLYLQFIPSLLKFLLIGSFAAAGFIFVLVMTFLFGRVYCSSVCPLGILQDIISFISKKVKRTRYVYKKPLSKTRYSLLIVSIIILLSGSVFALNLLDPYSNFGRILSNIVQPVAVGLNNSVAFFLENLNLYWIYPVEFRGIHLFSLLFSFGVLILVGWMSYKHGRLYCNTVCPVGTFLGFISKYSLFKIGISESNCISCGLCERVCKANCIDTDNSSIDFERCVACFNCFTSCSTDAIEYQFRYKKKQELEAVIDISKRDFFVNSAVYFIGANTILNAQKKIEVYKDSTVRIIRESAVSPPGSISIENFTDKCTACHLCVAACPTHVIQPSFLEYGFLGMMQPRMDYIKGFCNYDCIICGEVCPSGAILPQKVEEKKLIQLGKATFVKDNCIVYSQGTDCGACAEHCPTKAVRMVMDTDPDVMKKAPKIDEEICIGCGACEYACPTKPYKAIYVKSNPIHLAAKKPKEKELEQPDLEEVFPF